VLREQPELPLGFSFFKKKKKTATWFLAPEISAILLIFGCVNSLISLSPETA